MPLYPHQDKGITLLDQSLYLEQNQAAILCAPTGGGKTQMFSHYAQSHVRKGKAVMAMVNREELMNQADNKFRQFGMSAKLINAGAKVTQSNLYIASVDTLRRRQYPDLDVLFIDECHDRRFDPVVLHYLSQGTKIVGWTATPVRKGRKLNEKYPNYTGQLSDIYQDLIEPFTIEYLIQNGFLVPEIAYGVEIDDSQLDIEGQDFSEESLLKMFAKPELYAGVVENYRKWAFGKKAICFNINRAESIKVAALFNACGIPAAHVDGNTSAHERARIFKDFKYGIIKVLCNVGVATTGFDEPSIECVIVNKATMSLSLWLQMVGRGGRTCAEIGKDHFIVIDQGGNSYRHLPWSFPRTWSLTGEYISRKKGVPVVTNCPKCEAIISAAAKTCKYCGAVLAPIDTDTLVPGDRNEKTANFGLINKELFASANAPLHTMDLKQLEAYRIAKNYSIAWLSRQLWIRDESQMVLYGQMKGYSTAWAKKQLELAAKARSETKNEIWSFMQKNTHLTNEEIENYAAKKLKSSHSHELIKALIPKIVEAYEGLRKENIEAN